MPRATVHHRRHSTSRWAGVTLPELLVVVSIIGLSVAVAFPLIGQALSAARIRAAVNQFAVTVRAVRMIAVTTQQDRLLTIKPDPDNYYEYIDARDRTQRVHLPQGVQIVGFEMPPGIATGDPLRFQPNGSVAGGFASVTTLETRLDSGTIELWEIRTNMLGSTTVRREIRK